MSPPLPEIWEAAAQALSFAAHDIEYGEPLEHRDADLHDDELRLSMVALGAYEVLRRAGREADSYAMAVYGRRLSELYCMLVYGHFVKVEGKRYLGWSLYDSIEKLPNWACQYTAQEYIVPSRLVDAAAGLDLPPSVRMRDDLMYCAMQGNIHKNGKFVTASIVQLRRAGMIEHFEEATLRQAVCRIAAVLTSWLLRLRYGSADHLHFDLASRL